jgi:hypothetical protein
MQPRKLDHEREFVPPQTSYISGLHCLAYIVCYNWKLVVALDATDMSGMNE